MEFVEICTTTSFIAKLGGVNFTNPKGNKLTFLVFSSPIEENPEDLDKKSLELAGKAILEELYKRVDWE